MLDADQVYDLAVTCRRDAAAPTGGRPWLLTSGSASSVLRPEGVDDVGFDALCARAFRGALYCLRRPADCGGLRWLIGAAFVCRSPERRRVCGSPSSSIRRIRAIT